MSVIHPIFLYHLSDSSAIQISQVHYDVHC